MTEPLDRRRFLMSVPALLLAPRAFAQYASGRIRITSFNHVSLNVSDLKRSTEFYQGLFGMPIQSRQGATSVQLRIGTGPQFLNLSGAGAPPSIDHMCVGVENFDLTRILKVLADHGLAKSDQRGAMKVQLTRRGPDEGGAKEGTPEMHVGDPDGIDMQLQDKSYCGGAGALGNVSSAVEPSSKK